MAKVVARAIHCELSVEKPAVSRKELAVSVQVPVVGNKTNKVGASELENGKILLQPRLCTLRSYGEDGFAVVKSRKDGGDEVVSPFFETLSEYIESSKKSRDFEIISGRLAMIVFAATVGTEFVTGTSVFRKMDLQWIAEATGVCLGAVTCAAIFAWFSSARSRVGRIFDTSCNTFIDSLVDEIVDGLFYEGDQNDWSDLL
ncbi:stress enhanced protein 2, chloroplastic [Mercurialis annua]|uniref:stress enhanced protein 2, chloroplastic n=1 Tax=Mercurialis annua TaxID=3986 RepID=UPI00215ED976|nr:stress enhanced protein 2, chloroplastic [Mercurialis annua]